MIINEVSTWILISTCAMLGLYSIIQKVQIMKFKSENLNLHRILEREKLIEERKESFIANLTHDLKSPTYAQINSLKMLLNGTFGYLNPEQKEILDLAQGSCKYLSDLISTILDTYKLNQGKIQLNKTKFDLINLMLELKRDFLPVAKEKNQTILLQYCQNTVFLLADKLQIKRVIMNILNNAITYGDKNSDIKINITITKNNKMELTIENKADTLTDKELSELFKGFCSTKQSKFNSTSTGLGLYLSKQIIDMHNGEIFAKSTKDRTCIVGIKLGLAQIPKKEKVFEQLSK